MRICYSEYALESTDEPNFKPSRSRSKRLHKKLLKKFGYVHKPCIFVMDSFITGQKEVVAHPTFKESIERELQAYPRPSIL